MNEFWIYKDQPYMALVDISKKKSIFTKREVEFTVSNENIMKYFPDLQASIFEIFSEDEEYQLMKNYEIKIIAYQRDSVTYDFSFLLIRKYQDGYKSEKTLRELVTVSTGIDMRISK